MSEHTARLVDRLRQRLRATVQRMTLAEAAYGFVLTLGVVAAIWLLLAALEAGLWLDPTPRSALVSLVAAVVLGLTAYYLLRPLLRLVGLLSPPSEEVVARRVGAHYPEVSDRLVNVLQLAEGRRSRAPDAIVDRAVRALSEEVQPVAFEEIEDFSRARRASRIASLPVIGLLAFLVAAPNTFLDASERLLSPRTAFERPAPFQLAVEPGDADLVRGDSLRITVRAIGQQLPQNATLYTRQAGEDAVDETTLRADSTGVFRHTIVNVRQPMHYRIAARPVESPWYTAEVVARPLVRTVQATLTPPAYTNLPTRRLDANVGDVTGLPGTRVDLEVDLGGPEVDEALVAFDDGTRDTLSVDGDTATGRFTLQREGTYRLLLRSTDGVANRAPIEYAMKLRADARPSIVFLAPDRVADLPESLAQPLRLRLGDDFGFARLRLYYRVAERRFGRADSSFEALDLPLDAPRELDQEVGHRWHLQEESGLDLAPGDAVEYYAQVWDNDAVAGYKSARTETQTLRLPSLAEKYEVLDEQQDGTEQQMQDMMQETESIRRQFDELRNELRRKQSADWEDERQLDQLKQRQQKLDSNVDDVSQKMQEMTRQMQESDLADSETVERYQELQQVIEEVKSPEMMEMLDKLQQAMQDLDLEQMQQALENFEFNEQQYQERLDRALDLFKKLRMQQKLDEASRRAEDLSEQEQRLAEETQRRQEERQQATSDDADPDPNAPENADAQDEADAEPQAEGQEPSEASEQGARENTPEEGAQQGERRDRSEQEGATADEPAASERAHEDLAQQQERASEEMQALEEQLQQLREQMEEVRSAPKQGMQEIMQELQEQNLPEQMQQNSEQLRQDQLQEAQQGQQQMQQQLQQMQERLQQMQEGMQGQQKQMNLAGLRQALDNTLLLSKDQEGLRHDVRALSEDSPSMRQLAPDQAALAEGLRAVSDSLQRLARDVPQMTRAVQRETGNALREMQQATDALSERNARTASGHQRGSMMYLNELAVLLSNLLDQLMQGGQGGGMSMEQMLEQMQQMSGNQQQLNEQIQQLLNDAQGDRLSADEQERMEQLARQQETLKQQLEELGREGGARDQMLGDLDQIARQMEETIRELRENRQSRRTTDRQQEILTRMLNAQKSLREQGQEEEREGDQPEEQEFDRERPGELAPEEQIDRLRRDLIRALETGYAPDYEELIKRYFELLQEQEE